MKYNKGHAGLGATFAAAILLSALMFTAPMAAVNMVTGAQTYMPRIFNMAFADGSTHDIKLSAENLPNGQFAYKMVKHMVTTGGDTTDMTSKYPSDAVIPGPTLFVKEGDLVNVVLTNNAGTSVGFNVPGLSNGNAQVNSGQTKSFSFTASPAGTYEYRDKESAMVGLFGAIVVDKMDGSVEPYVDGDDGNIVATNESDLDKQFVLFMVGSTFWGTEIAADGSQTPVWTNPTLGADLDEIVRFHILSVGPGHTFHLHAHRWVDPGTNNVIDTKLMEDGIDTHSFTVKAGDGVGSGHWQYHCHVFAHMEAGMHGTFHVGGITVPGASPYGVHSLLGGGPSPGLVTFEISDEPGSWFRNTLDISGVTVTRSLALARPGDSVNFVMSDTFTVHTVTSLLWPTGAPHMPFTQVTSYKGGGIVALEDPGLYVFTCQVHPYMFGSVIADDPGTEELDLGQSVTLVNGLEVPTASDLLLRLVRTFFVATAPENWQHYTDEGSTWDPSYPAVPVLAYDGDGNEVSVPNLDAFFDSYFSEPVSLDALSDPSTAGVGEVWVDTQFEKTASKTKPGTITVLNATTWEISKKVSLPEINMNNPHNMWTDESQELIYQTQWFDNKMTVIDRETGAMVDNIRVGEAPAHVQTRPNNDDIIVTLNGEEGISYIPAGGSEVDYIIPTQGYGELPAHPHAHWISADGQKVVTPNVFTSDGGIYDLDTGNIDHRTTDLGFLPHSHPIATGMMPDSSKYYVANLLDNSISVIDMSGGTLIKEINLLEDYNPLAIGGAIGDGAFPFDSEGPDGILQLGALPIQTPVSPDGKFVVTANTLTATITIVDTSTDEIATTLFCDPGCHGVQFGAKDGGGYYAYVSSKFSDELIVVDADPNGDGDASDAYVAGTVSLVGDESTPIDDPVTELAGYGGQGIMPVPNVYHGWVQNLPEEWKALLTEEQKNPVP